ncbi:uncharacterized protein LOC112571671 [Pomacea canaliculata]|uniref:uncharacterized protein LOC112571671 n=1 Tax=Pomacea canaliculata TaxID=400727 RepID=UPI000D72DB0B|nr:uncharacterized protein LOC112571671 [Pomacea canaliculata]
MNEIRVQGLLLDRYNTDFLGLLHKLNRTVCTPTSAPTSVPAPTCSVSKSCGAGRTWIGEMRGPLREKITKCHQPRAVRPSGQSSGAHHSRREETKQEEEKQEKCNQDKEE